MIVLIVLAKLIVMSLLIDAWLYWIHRAYHSDYSPDWIKRIHYQHHESFNHTRVFSLHPVEFLVSISAPFFIVWSMFGLWFFPFALFWAVFEAARGHGHFKWFKLIPKIYYKKLMFCGIRYHDYHHDTDVTKNLGQFLKIWDKICGTERAYPPRS